MCENVVFIVISNEFFWGILFFLLLFSCMMRKFFVVVVVFEWKSLFYFFFRQHPIRNDDNGVTNGRKSHRPVFNKRSLKTLVRSHRTKNMYLFRLSSGVVVRDKTRKVVYLNKHLMVCVSHWGRLYAISLHHNSQLISGIIHQLKCV